MQLGRVLGTVVATVKHPSYGARTLLMVQPVTPYGEAVGNSVIAVDVCQAGEGDLVLLLSEGTGARQILVWQDAPIRDVAVGVVDRVDLPAAAR